MNRAEINGKSIEDGDYVIIDSEAKNAETGDVVLAIIDNKATIKKFIRDEKNEQIVLKADSSFDYEPIYLHPDDEFFINGKVIGVIKKPDDASINYGSKRRFQNVLNLFIPHLKIRY